MNYEVAMTVDSNAEIAALLKSAKYHVGLTGLMNFTSDSDVSELVFKELTS